MGRTYTSNTRIYTETGDQVELIKGINAIRFKNNGTSICYVNGLPIAVNESVSINGNPGEEDRTTYKLAFATGGTNSLCVTVLNYTD